MTCATWDTWRLVSSSSSCSRACSRPSITAVSCTQAHGSLSVCNKTPRRDEQHGNQPSSELQFVLTATRLALPREAFPGRQHPWETFCTRPHGNGTSDPAFFD